MSWSFELNILKLLTLSFFLLASQFGFAASSQYGIAIYFYTFDSYYAYFYKKWIDKAIQHCDLSRFLQLY